MKILLMDIETAPHKVYAWGLWDQRIAINQIVEPGYTISWAAKWLGDDEMMYRGLNTHSPKQMIKGIHKLLEEADAVIHYYGSNFDIPTLNKEFLLHGLDRPSPYKQIDLIRTVRRQFKLASNKLDYVLKFLGYEGKIQHKGMELWKGCMAMDPKSWKVMEKYNKQDVSELENLYYHLLPWIDMHPNVAMYNEDPTPQCPKCGGKHLHKRGTARTNTYTYQRLRCMDCGSWLRERFNNMEKAKKKALLVEAR